MSSLQGPGREGHVRGYHERLASRGRDGNLEAAYLHRGEAASGARDGSDEGSERGGEGVNIRRARSAAAPSVMKTVLIWTPSGRILNPIRTASFT